MSHSKGYLRLRQKLVHAVVRDVKFIHAVTIFGKKWKEKTRKHCNFDVCLYFGEFSYQIWEYAPLLLLQVLTVFFFSSFYQMLGPTMLLPFNY